MKGSGPLFGALFFFLVGYDLSNRRGVKHHELLPEVIRLGSPLQKPPNFR